MTKKKILFVVLLILGLYELKDLLFGTRHAIDALLSVIFLSLSSFIYFRWLK